MRTGFLAILCLFSTISIYSTEKPIVVVTSSYNNKNVFEKNLSSLFNQDYDHWRLIYIDDCSTDGTADAVEAYIHEHKQEKRVTLIRNTARCYQLHNQYHAIHSCPKDAIIAILDGDDWLAHPSVLSYINQIYQTEDVWLTYGQFAFSSTQRIGYCAPLPSENGAKHPFRKRKWVSGHLRTFYAGLFHCIAIEDLLVDGNFFSASADLAIMFPMLEMAGRDHIQFIESVLYIYNDDDPSKRCDRMLQLELESEIRSRPPYKLLESSPIPIK
jgi:glycosyltransferase involved in cell wall biosynthesis